VNLAQIRSAVPEIFHTQTKNKMKKSQTALKAEAYLRVVINLSSPMSRFGQLV